jgi:hypothetical protein
VEALIKPRIYLETSVFGNYYDVKSIFHQETIILFDAIVTGQFIAYTSRYTFFELKNTPDESKRNNFINLISDYNLTVIPRSREITTLGRIYIKEKIIPQTNILMLYISLVRH